MMTTQSFEPEELTIELDREDLEDVEEPTQPPPSPSIIERLDGYRLLPLQHASLPERLLLSIEQVFLTWYELADDRARRAALPYLLGTEADVRAVLLAIVPLYYDDRFFDEWTPTRELIEIVLMAHAKWRRWLASKS
jgi:hypothetical protein